MAPGLCCPLFRRRSSQNTEGHNVMPASSDGETRRARSRAFEPRATARAFLILLCTTAIVLGLHALFPTRAFIFLYLPMVAVIALAGGRVAGLLGVGASLVATWYVFLG